MKGITPVIAVVILLVIVVVIVGAGYTFLKNVPFLPSDIRFNIIDNCQDEFYDVEGKHRFLWDLDKQCENEVCSKLNLSRSFQGRTI